ncbi:MAG TPA: DUF554 domain-containing protein [Candidatus Wirthbacteria bacterium]|nr:DUF554 domain-containing protein [Candidatus Wirthbacteria bacterium]
MQGTLYNTGAVVLGSMIGLLFHSRLPERFAKIFYQAIGLLILSLGLGMVVKLSDFLLLSFSIIGGAFLGELVDISSLVNRTSEKLKSKIKSQNDNFSEGFVTGILVMCVGTLAVLGPLEEGLGKGTALLQTKSVIDFVTSILLASSLGVGVLFSALPLLVYQGSITLFAGSLQGFFSDTMIANLSVMGGVLLLGVGLGVLKIKKINVINMLPSLVMVAILSFWF